MSTQFEQLKKKLSEQISKSKTPEDLSHAQNTMEWVLKLRPDADEILQLAGLAHDIQRSYEERLTKNNFSNYDEYLSAHAKRSAEIASQFALESGYGIEEADRLKYIISEGEFNSQIPDIQLLRDANSISIFDNNLRFYLANKGKEWTKTKMEENYKRSSELARHYIQQVLLKKPEQN